jgi:hypothetical protein
MLHLWNRWNQQKTKTTSSNDQTIDNLTKNKLQVQILSTQNRTKRKGVTVKTKKTIVTK